MKNEKSKLIKKLSKAALAATLAVTLMTPANATLQQNINGGNGKVLDNTTAPDGMASRAIQLVDPAIADGLGTIDTNNGVLEFEGNPFILANTPITNIQIDARTNQISNLEFNNFADLPNNNIGDLLAVGANGKLVSVGGQAGEVYVSAGPGLPGAFTVIGGGGNGTVASVASTTNLLSVTDPTANARLTVNPENFTSLGQAGQPLTLPGNVTIDNLTVNSSVNNTVIGDVNPAAGTFTNLTATNTIFAAQGTAAKPSITFSDDTDNNLGFFLKSENTLGIASNGQEVLAIDNTGLALAAGTNLNAPGFSSTSVNIDGGSIDGTAIGFVAQSTGAFTTLSASGDLTVEGTNIGRGTGLSSTLVGANQADAAGQDAVAVGENTKATGTASVAIGSDASAANSNGVAIGNDATSSLDNSVAIANQANASGQDAVAVGESTQATGTASVAVGSDANAAGNNAIALGNDANAAAENGIAIGNGANTGAFTNATAIGNGATATANDQIAIGDNTNTVVIAGNLSVLGSINGNTGATSNEVVLARDSFALSPTATNQNLSLNSRTRRLEFANPEFIVDLVNRQVELCDGQLVAINNNTVDLTSQLNLTLTINQLAGVDNSIDLIIPNTTGFDAIARTFISEQIGPSL